MERAKLGHRKRRLSEGYTCWRGQTSGVGWTDVLRTKGGVGVVVETAVGLQEKASGQAAHSLERARSEHGTKSELLTGKGRGRVSGRNRNHCYLGGTLGC